ncbi:MAG: ribbon-helix-helix domain-containing protein [Gammaproteobacteria bacterium]|nr:ribbon-helix-helix domain-containing protein [Gammaproteobacteria bacterium]MBU1653341.1 ribbon-helix-helix domain-containing protein [Gammaproteobacteria bacterium]MBU1962769.1 ribbon-helix-helix domain-containing protein [Gammaproteobacteria bacterium]
MNFNIYLDDETGRQLAAAAEQAGESRNALIRKALCNLYRLLCVISLEQCNRNNT